MGNGCSADDIDTADAIGKTVENCNMSLNQLFQAIRYNVHQNYIYSVTPDKWGNLFSNSIDLEYLIKLFGTVIGSDIAADSSYNRASLDNGNATSKSTAYDSPLFSYAMKDSGGEQTIFVFLPIIVDDDGSYKGCVNFGQFAMYMNTYLEFAKYLIETFCSSPLNDTTIISEIDAVLTKINKGSSWDDMVSVMEEGEAEDAEEANESKMKKAIETLNDNIDPTVLGDILIPEGIDATSVIGDVSTLQSYSDIAGSNSTYWKNMDIGFYTAAGVLATVGWIIGPVGPLLALGYTLYKIFGKSCSIVCDLMSNLLHTVISKNNFIGIAPETNDNITTYYKGAVTCSTWTTDARILANQITLWQISYAKAKSESFESLALAANTILLEIQSLLASMAIELENIQLIINNGVSLETELVSKSIAIAEQLEAIKTDLEEAKASYELLLTMIGEIDDNVGQITVQEAAARATLISEKEAANEIIKDNLNTATLYELELVYTKLQSAIDNYKLEIADIQATREAIQSQIDTAKTLENATDALVERIMEDDAASLADEAEAIEMENNAIANLEKAFSSSQYISELSDSIIEKQAEVEDIIEQERNINSLTEDTMIYTYVLTVVTIVVTLLFAFMIFRNIKTCIFPEYTKSIPDLLKTIRAK